MLNTSMPSTDPNILQADLAAIKVNRFNQNMHMQLTWPGITCSLALPTRLVPMNTYRDKRKLHIGDQLMQKSFIGSRIMANLSSRFDDTENLSSMAVLSVNDMKVEGDSLKCSPQSCVHALFVHSTNMEVADTRVARQWPYHFLRILMWNLIVLVHKPCIVHLHCYATVVGKLTLKY